MGTVNLLQHVRLGSIFMLFFALMVASTVLARLANALFTKSSESWIPHMRWGMASVLVFFGLDHLTTPERYLPMLPSFLPYPESIVTLTGVCEIIGGFGLMLRQVRKFAGIMLAIYFICVFPANIKNALEGVSVEGLPNAQWYYWIRLLFQPVAIWWVLYSTEVIRKSPIKHVTPKRR